MLTEGLGWTRAAVEDGTTRYTIGIGGSTRIVDVRAVGGFLPAIGGMGTVHHVAFRAGDEASELTLRGRVTELGMAPTPVLDREYFRSVYFREPGGVLFELATDAPGSTVDEPLEQLGRSLMLPPQHVANRSAIESRLPTLHDPITAPLAFAEAESLNESRGNA